MHCLVGGAAWHSGKSGRLVGSGLLGGRGSLAQWLECQSSKQCIAWWEGQPGTVVRVAD